VNERQAKQPELKSLDSHASLKQNSTGCDSLNSTAPASNPSNL
jgi:hypothetical protein